MHFSYLGRMITNDAGCTREIKYRIAMAKTAFNNVTLFTIKLDVRKKVEMCYIWSIALCSAETWIFRKSYEKYVEGFLTWRWRRMEEISWTDHVGKEILHRVKEERDIVQTIKRREGNWIGHIFCRNCHRKHVIEGKIDGRMWREYEEEDVNSYWLTLRKWEGSGNWKRKL